MSDTATGLDSFSEDRNPGHRTEDLLNFDLPLVTYAFTDRKLAG